MSLLGTSARRLLTFTAPFARANSTTTAGAGAGAGAAPPASASATTHYRITLRRSAIGLPAKTTRVLTSLGLFKRLQTIFRPQRPDIAGSILAVKELVHVDTVRRLDGGLDAAARAQLEALRAQGGESDDVPALMVMDEDAVWVDEKGEVVDWGRQSRKAPRGYRVVGNIVDPARNAEIQQSGER